MLNHSTTGTIPMKCAPWRIAFFTVAATYILQAFSPASASVTPQAVAEPSASEAAASTHITQAIAGWNLHIHRQLLAEHPVETGKAVELLRGQLARITELVPSGTITHLQRVPLWFNPCPLTNAQPKAEYHPDARWLRANDRNPAMEKSVEFTNILIFERECRRMPMLAFHELAHAFHHQVLGYNEPRIIEAYENAKKGGKYGDVERWTGEATVKTKAYALTNFKEYFAETSEAFFGRNDFQPFDRDELRQMDPEMHVLLERLWQTP